MTSSGTCGIVKELIAAAETRMGAAVPGCVFDGLPVVPLDMLASPLIDGTVFGLASFFVAELKACIRAAWVLRPGGGVLGPVVWAIIISCVQNSKSSSETRWKLDDPCSVFAGDCPWVPPFAEGDTLPLCFSISAISSIRCR